MIQADDIDTTMAFIHRYLGSKAEGREIGLTEAIESAEREPSAPSRGSVDIGLDP